MNIKEIFFDLFGMFIERKTSDKRVRKILKKLLPKKINFNLIRLGEDNDGGYLVPNDLNNIDQNYSAGVGILTKFEKDLEEKFSISSNMLDFNEIDKGILPKKSEFIKKKLSLNNNQNEISINNWIEEIHKEIILKIDIEGDEYITLSNITDQNLKKIRIFIVEFHGLRNLRSDSFLNFFEKIVSRIDKYFYSCHLHVNNTSKIKRVNNLKIPDMVEVTFIRKDRVTNFSNEFSELPHPLDQKTVLNKDEIFIDKNWYINDK